MAQPVTRIVLVTTSTIATVTTITISSTTDIVATVVGVVVAAVVVVLMEVVIIGSGRSRSCSSKSDSGCESTSSGIGSSMLVQAAA